MENLENEKIAENVSLEETLESLEEDCPEYDDELDKVDTYVSNLYATGDTISDYIKSIGQYPVLTKEKETELFHILRSENSTDEEKQQAREQIYLCNLKLVVYVAKRFHSRNPAVDFMDIIQEGNAGISRAIDLFEPERGNKFSTYATIWIRQSITRGLMNTNHFIRVPVHVAELLSRIEKERNEYKLEHFGKEPSKEELITRIGCTRDAFENALSMKQNLDVTSLQTTVGEEDDTFLFELIEDQNAPDPTQEVMLKDFRKTVDEILNNSKRLSERDREIFRIRFGWDTGTPRTLEDIGKIYGITRERVRQIETKVFRVLRSPKNAAKLSTYKDML